MDFAKSDIQTMLLDSAGRLLSGMSNIEYWRKQRQQPLGFDEARWMQFAELGWLALPLPEAAGGLDGTLEDVALLNITLGRALVTEPYASSVVLANHILGQASDRERACVLQGQIATGVLRVALAHMENGVDPLTLDGVVSTARPTEDGFRLDGAKLLVLDAPSAGQLIVSARVGEENGVGLFLVPAEAEGLVMERYPLIDGSLAADIRLTDVRLPPEALLLAGTRGIEVLAEAIDHTSVVLMAQAVGAMEAANKVCAAYVQGRKQFGRAIGSFQAIQHIMADMFVAAHQARSMLYHALANMDRPAGERASALSAARLVVGEAGQLVARNGIQVHGGYGLTDEYAISHFFRRILTLEKQYGDIALHRERFGNSIFA